MNILYVPLQVVWARSSAQHRSLIDEPLSGPFVQVCLLTLKGMLLENVSMTWWHWETDRRKPEQAATSDMSFEEHLSVVGPQPSVSRETALSSVDSESHLLSLYPPAEHSRESFLLGRDLGVCLLQHSKQSLPHTGDTQKGDVISGRILFTR